MLLEYMEIPKIADDEDISGWFRAIAQANGWDYYSFDKAFNPVSTAVRSETLHRICGYRQIYKEYGRLGFPNPQEAFMLHTEIPVSGLFTAPYYTGMVADMFLNGADTEPFKNMLLHEPFRYCPECAKEDMAAFGRRIVHIPHQVIGVTACYRHGLKLAEDADTEALQAGKEEIRTAQLVSTLYRHRTVGSVDDVKRALKERATENGIEIRDEKNRDTDTVTMHHLASLFTDDEVFSLYEKSDGWLMKGVDNIRKFSPESHSFTRDFPFLHYTCGKCGTENTVYAYTPMTGGICPVCARGQTWQEKTTRRLRCVLDPGYEAVGLPDKMHVDILHRECGNVMEGKHLRSVLRSGWTKCANCMKKKHNASMVSKTLREQQRDSRIGELFRQNCGQDAVITEYKNSSNCTVRFSNGEVRTDVSYWNFKAGRVLPPSMQHRSRVGGVYKQECGQYAEIIKSNGTNSLTVRFENGKVRTGVNYEKLKLGKVLPPSMQHRSRVGGVYKQECGQYAEVIEDNGANNLTVQFENGMVRKRVRLADLKKGTVEPLTRLEKIAQKYVGREGLMNCGKKAKIVAYRGYSDIDALFETGELREHVNIHSFNRGAISPVPRKRCRKEKPLRETEESGGSEE